MSFQSFTRKSGEKITVEYESSGSFTPPSYSPYSGADGGNIPEFVIIKAWNTETLKDVELLDEEIEEFEVWLAENVDLDDYFH